MTLADEWELCKGGKGMENQCGISHVKPQQNWDLSRQRASCRGGFNFHPKVHLEAGREISDNFILQFLQSFS